MIKNKDNDEFFSGKDAIDKASINNQVTEIVGRSQNNPETQKDIILNVNRSSN